MRTLFGDHERYEEVYFKPFPGYYYSGDGEDRDYGHTHARTHAHMPAHVAHPFMNKDVNFSFVLCE